MLHLLHFLFHSGSLVERDHQQIFHESGNSEIAWIHETFESSSMADATEEKVIKEAFMTRLGKSKMQVEPMMRASGILGKTSSGKRYSVFKFDGEDHMKPMRIKSD